jgi:hypothetical protein
VNFLDGLVTSGNLVTNIFGGPDLFLYYDMANNPFLHGNYFLQGGGELIAFGDANGGGTGGGTDVPEPPTLALVLAGLSFAASAGWYRRRRGALR